MKAFYSCCSFKNINLNPPLFSVAILARYIPSVSRRSGIAKYEWWHGPPRESSRKILDYVVISQVNFCHTAIRVTLHICFAPSNFHDGGDARGISATSCCEHCAGYCNEYSVEGFRGIISSCLPSVVLSRRIGCERRRSPVSLRRCAMPRIPIRNFRDAEVRGNVSRHNLVPHETCIM